MQELVDVRERLAKMEQEYNLILNNIPAAVFKGYADWSVDLFDNKIEEMTGYLKLDFDSRQIKWSDLILIDDIEKAKAVFLKALKTEKKTYVREYRIKNKKGEPIWIQERSIIVCNPEGRIEFISGIFFDITDRVQTEINAEKRCEYLEALVMKLKKEAKPQD